MDEGAEIWFKTDDDDLFRDSLHYFPAAGFEITWQTFDLHANEPDWNLRTEHEGMFTEMGIPIKALIARKGPDSTVTWVEPQDPGQRAGRRKRRKLPKHPPRRRTPNDPDRNLFYLSYKRCIVLPLRLYRLGCRGRLRRHQGAAARQPRVPLRPHLSHLRLRGQVLN